MAVTLLFLKQRAIIDSVELDASLHEVHKATVTTTSHPVEQGVKITDHKYREPDGLTLTGLVSNDPMPDPADPGEQSTFQSSGGGTLNYNARSSFDPTLASTAYQQLLDLLDSPDLISVVTSIREYDNLVMTGLEVPRDAHSGESLEFTATFTTIKVVNNQTVQIQASTTKAQNPSDLHKKVATPASASVAHKSILKSITESNFAQHPLDTISGAFSGGTKVGF